MGSYREEYESYYKKILGKSPSVSKNDKDDILGNKDIDKRIHVKTSSVDVTKYFVKVNLLSTFVCVAMSGLLVIGKAYPQGQDVYDYVKQVSKVNFYYKDMVEGEVSKLVFNVNDKIKKETEKSSTAEGNNVGIKPFDDFEVVKKDSSEILKENSVLPLSGKVSFGEIQGIKDKNILLSSGDINVKSVYKGKVKEVGSDEQLGEFMVIDSGNGVDIKYGNLKSISKKVGEEVTTGERIAEVDNNSNKKINGVILQIIDGGEYKDPNEYINIK